MTDRFPYIVLDTHLLSSFARLCDSWILHTLYAYLLDRSLVSVNIELRFAEFRMEMPVGGEWHIVA